MPCVDLDEAVVTLDEPLGALDLKLRRQMQVELKRIQTEVGLTFIHVTHDQEEAMTMADTVAVMNRGHIEQLGAPEELYDLPRTRFVANFVGQANTGVGTIKDVDGDHLVVNVLGSGLLGVVLGLGPGRAWLALLGVGALLSAVRTGRWVG